MKTTTYNRIGNGTICFGLLLTIVTGLIYYLRTHSLFYALIAFVIACYVSIKILIPLFVLTIDKAFYRFVEKPKIEPENSENYTYHRRKNRTGEHYLIPLYHIYDIKYRNDVGRFIPKVWQKCDCGSDTFIIRESPVSWREVEAECSTCQKITTTSPACCEKTKILRDVYPYTERHEIGPFGPFGETAFYNH